MTTSGILYTLTQWAENLNDDNRVFYNGLSQIDASNTPNPWKELWPSKVYKYAAMYTTKSIHMFSTTSLASVVEALGRILEMDQIYQYQRTVEDCLAFLVSERDTMEDSNFPLRFEMFLRRTNSEYCLVLLNGGNPWLIHLLHPKLGFSLWTFSRYLYFRDSRLMIQYLKYHPEMEPYFDKIENVIITSQTTVYYNLGTSKAWLNSFYMKLLQFCLNENDDDILFHMFVHPRITRSENIKHRIKTIKPMNLPSTPCILRQFCTRFQFETDVSALRIPSIFQSMQPVLQKTQPHVYYLVEQTALMTTLTIQFYLASPSLQSYQRNIHVYPRTATTCYLVATAEAMKVLFYCQIPNMERRIGHGRSVNSDNPHQQSKFLVRMERPPIFPVLLRTWLECQWNAEIPRKEFIEAIGMQQVLLTVLRWCYLAGNKDLTNTWFSDNLDAYANYNKWEWIRDGDGMNASMLSIRDPNFVPFYSNLFSLLTVGWTDLSDLRKNLILAKKGQPDMDDYLAEGPCSIFAFIESFVFIQGIHAIRFDIIDWLMQTIIVSEEYRAKEIQTQYPPAQMLVRTLFSLAIQQKEKNKTIQINSARERQWRNSWLILHSDIPNRHMLIQCYYLLILLPLWKENEAREMILSCRLAPRYPLGEFYEPTVPDPMDVESKPRKPQEEEVEEADRIFEELMHASKDTNEEEEEAPTSAHDLLEGIFRGTSEMSSVDLSSSMDDYDSDDNFSYSSMDESDNELAPKVHLNTSFKLKRKRRTKREEVDRNYVQAKFKRRRVTDEKEEEEKKVEEAVKIKRSYTKWNTFTQLLTRREIVTISDGGIPQPLPIPRHQSVHVRECQIEFFAALEDCIRDRNMSLEHHDLVEAVMNNQLFTKAIEYQNRFVVYFGMDNLQKLYRIQSSSVFTSANYVTHIMEKISKINSFHYQKFAQEVFSKYACRLYFDHEVLFIPGIIDRVVSEFSMETYQRQVLEFIFDQVPRQDYLKTPITMNTPSPPSMNSMISLMPPPPSRQKSASQSQQMQSIKGAKLW